MASGSSGSTLDKQYSPRNTAIWGTTLDNNQKLSNPNMLKITSRDIDLLPATIVYAGKVPDTVEACPEV